MNLHHALDLILEKILYVQIYLAIFSTYKGRNYFIFAVAPT